MSAHLLSSLIFGLTFIIQIECQHNYVAWAKKQFTNSFYNVCWKYSWVKDYIRNEKVHNRYAIFIFHNGSRNSYVGGLGDRLSGLISVFAFALRTNRTFLIETDDIGLIESFSPLKKNIHQDINWGSWEWAGWNSSLENLYKLKSTLCLNHRAKGHLHCKLDKDFPDPVIRLMANRAFLCRWVELPHLSAYQELRGLGITTETDLFEAAGCMLRLALWPTDKLWQALNDRLATSTALWSGRHSLSPRLQIGSHFRCGDHALGLSEKHLKRKYVPPVDCAQRASKEWTGTHPLGYHSMDSPVHVGRCALKLINASRLPRQSAERGGQAALVYVTSDSKDAARQVNTTLSWPATFVDEFRCHIDYQASANCTIGTATTWLMLANSDYIILQSYYSHSWKAISAFSRYAAIYSLRPDVFRFALRCESVNKTAMSRIAQGNWACGKGTDKWT